MFNLYNVVLIFLIIFLVFSQPLAQEVKNSETTKKDSSGKNEILIHDIYHKNLISFQLVITPRHNIQSQYLNSDFEYKQ